MPKIIKEAEKISKAFEKDATAVVKLINRINDNVKKARSQMEVGFAITDQGKTLVEEAEKKMADLNAHDVDEAAKIIAGSAKSMGIEVVE